MTFKMFYRFVHSDVSNVQPSSNAHPERIYNTKINVIEGGWKPQTPTGPVHDGWALKVVFI